METASKNVNLKALNCQSILEQTQVKAGNFSLEKATRG